MRRALLLSAFALLLATSGRLAAAPDVSDTRLLSMPAVSARHVAFGNQACRSDEWRLLA
jgi:hypothetical protein